MGGTPRGKDKPGPSYENGELRDPEIAKAMDATIDTKQVMERLLRRAVRENPHS